MRGFVVPSYVTLGGQVLDLTSLNQQEQEYLARCLDAYRQGVDWLALAALADGKENPLVRATGGWITRAVWEHPLYRAVRDLEARLAIRQGELAADPGDEPNRDPLAAEDKAASVASG